MDTPNMTFEDQGLWTPLPSLFLGPPRSPLLSGRGAGAEVQAGLWGMIPSQLPWLQTFQGSPDRGKKVLFQR